MVSVNRQYTNTLGNHSMSTKKIEFNVKGIDRIKYQGKDEIIPFGDGLYLRVRSSSKVWIYRTRNDGKLKVVTIGKFPDISPTEAKREALELAMQSSAITAKVKTLVEAYYDGMVATKHKHPEQAKRYLDLIVAQFGNSTIRSVKRLELTTWLRTYSKGRPRAGDMMRSHLKKIFAYAVECGYIDNSPDEGITNLDGDRWRKDDTKNGKAHWVYLPPLAMQQLPLPQCTATNIQSWIKRLLKKHGYQSEIRQEGYNAYTTHDLRRTFATRLNDAGVEPFVVEKCTNHTMEGVMAVYNRAEYETQRIEAAHKMQALIIQIINNNETN